VGAPASTGEYTFASLRSRLPSFALKNIDVVACLHADIHACTHRMVYPGGPQYMNSGFPGQPTGYPQQLGGYPMQTQGYPMPMQPGGMPMQPRMMPMQPQVSPQEHIANYVLSLTWNVQVITCDPLAYLQTPCLLDQLGKDLNSSYIDVYRTFTEKLSMRIHTHGEHPYISARETQGLMDIISQRPASRIDIRPEKSMAFQMNLKSCPS